MCTVKISSCTVEINSCTVKIKSCTVKINLYTVKMNSSCLVESFGERCRGVCENDGRLLVRECHVFCF